MARKWLTTALELTGLALVIAGTWLFSWVAGLIVLGLGFILIGVTQA